jgi:hypothetical protein
VFARRCRTTIRGRCCCRRGSKSLAARAVARLPRPRGRLAAGAIRFAKSRLVLPVVRWLFEYAQENFRRQHHLNVVLMATVQTLAADHAR